SKDAASAREELMGRDWPAADVAPLIALIDDPRYRIADDQTYRLSDAQARAILELRLARLTALGRDEIGEELEKLAAEITDYLDILRSRARVRTIIKDELAAVRDEFATPRKTEIVEGGAELEDEDLIQREDMVVTVTHEGWIKRVPLDTYRAQRRGGKGRSGMAMKEEDFVTRVFVASTHAPLLFFSSEGQVYRTKVWRLPLAAPQARGRSLVNLLSLSEGERITTVIPIPEDEAGWDALQVMFATNVGSVRRNRLSDCVPRTTLGKRVMEFEADGQKIIDVQLCGTGDDVLLTTAQGQCIRFPIEEVRVFGGNGSTGTSLGNRGITLEAGDMVISMAILRHFEVTPAERDAYFKMSRAVRGESEPDEASAVPEEADRELDQDGGTTAAMEFNAERYATMSAAEQFIFTVSENGYGKRTSSFEYRTTRRGGKGIVAMVVNDRNGRLVASFPVEASDQIMLVSDGGKIIRMGIDDIRIIGRGTQGVIVFDTEEDEKVVSVERLSEEGAAAADDSAPTE
ncbi:MAG: DNA gyrase subunit A, partial [Bauldia sp.]